MKLMLPSFWGPMIFNVQVYNWLLLYSQKGIQRSLLSQTINVHYPSFRSVGDLHMLHMTCKPQLKHITISYHWPLSCTSLYFSISSIIY